MRREEKLRNKTQAVRIPFGVPFYSIYLDSDISHHDCGREPGSTTLNFFTKLCFRTNANNFNAVEPGCSAKYFSNAYAANSLAADFTARFTAANNFARHTDRWRSLARRSDPPGERAGFRFAAGASERNGSG